MLNMNCVAIRHRNREEEKAKQRAERRENFHVIQNESQSTKKEAAKRDSQE